MLRMVDVGNVVKENEGSLLSVQTISTVYADFTQSVSEMQQLRRALATGDLEAAGAEAAKVRLVLDNGEAYGHDGKLLFSDSTVDPGTGQVTLRAVGCCAALARR